MLPKNILVLRFSAMGDVMLLVPVLRSLTQTYPEVNVTLVTRPRFASFFSNIPQVKLLEADVDGAYSGFFGIRNLFKKIFRHGHYDLVVDVHDHIRTQLLKSFFWLFGTPVVTFRKGRSEKKALVRKKNKHLKPLPHTVQRYHEVFTRIGFQFKIHSSPHLLPDPLSLLKAEAWEKENNLVKKEKWIGIAPFAMHNTKIWPLPNYFPLIQHLVEVEGYKIFFFGGGEQEIQFFENLQKKHEGACFTIAGKMDLSEETAFLQKVDLMVCVDSSNMHLAALSGVPILSIWGGTHPYTGFSPYPEKPGDILQIPANQMPCRPCSVYGKRSCYRKDFACLTQITPDEVLNHILKKISELPA